MTLPVAKPEALYELLPAVYRISDYELGGPLRALMQVLEEPYRVVEADIQALYDDWFVETCADWLVPYIADLVGVRDALDPNGVIPTVRSRVANALAYSRRKGPAWVLAHAARDVTGWQARAVEYYQLLGQTQDLDDVRAELGRTADLRFSHAVTAGTPFDRMARTVEVRGSDANGRWAADRVGLFLWRLRSYPVTRSQPREAGEAYPGCFTFCPFGADTQLFLPPRTEEPFGAEPSPWHVPAPVGRELLELVFERSHAPGDPWQAGEYPVVRVYAGDDAATAVRCPLWVADLGEWRVPDFPAPGDRWATAPRAVVDPECGRLAFLDGARPAWVRAEWSYGFGADLGGGPYARGAADPVPSPDAFVAQVGARHPMQGAVEAASLEDAVARWALTGAAEGVVRLGDSATHPCPVAALNVPPGRRLWIIAAPGERPCLSGDLSLEGVDRSGVILDGVLVDGTVWLTGNLDLTAHDCTLGPPVGGAHGDARRSVAARSGFAGGVMVDYTGSVVIARSVLGPLGVPASAAGVAVSDSIVAGGVYALAAGSSDADAGAGASLTADRCTVFGVVRAQSVSARDSIFVDPVLVEDASTGGLTCCYAPPGPRMPARDRCQPARGSAGVRPVFTSRRYGDAAFAQLSSDCATSIRTGASDGAEMGAFHLLDTPRREANLRLTIAEFLPNGLEALISYVT